MSYDQIAVAIMSRLIEQADRDITEASDMCRSLRDRSDPGSSAKAKFRAAADHMEQALVMVQDARNRLGL